MNQQECLFHMFFIGVVFGQWNCDRENDRLSRGGKYFGLPQSKKKQGKARDQNKKRKRRVSRFASARR